MEQVDKYSFSFTGGSALIVETHVVGKEYREGPDWAAVEKRVLEENLLKKVKMATSRREFREVKKRIQNLTDDQQRILVEGDFEDSKAMVLLALVKTYSYLKDFIVEVVRNKYAIFENMVRESDYSQFFNSKFLSHPELSNITETTTKKVKQLVFRFLEQVGLLTHARNGIIVKPILSHEAKKAIMQDDPFFLKCFLYSDQEIKDSLSAEGL